MEGLLVGKMGYTVFMCGWAWWVRFNVYNVERMGWGKGEEFGCGNLGLYHPIRPVQLKNNIIKIKNIKMLYYYHNRLVGFNLEKIFNN